jgi:hypothetical protein
VILLPLLACAARVAVGDGIADDVPAPAHYDRSVAAATRELRLYDGLSTALLMRATWLDPTFRTEEEAERAHLLLLEPPAHEARLTASLAEAATTHVFVLSADSQWREDLKFGFGEDAPWRLRAFVDGRACTPVATEEVKTPTALDRSLFPHQTPWSHLWIARFSTDCGASGKLILQATGPHGTGEMGWPG